MLQGYKTIITSIVTAVFNVLMVMFPDIPISEETIESVNAGLLALVGLFLAFKIERKNPEPGR